MGRQRKGGRVMAFEKLPLHLIGVYQDAFNRTAYADGSVDSTGVKTIMRSVGQNPSDAEVADMINQVDKDGTGSLDFPGFLMMMCLKSDGDGNGFINRQELACVMGNLGIELSSEEVQSMIDEADQDGDGQINYEEFYTMMNC